MIKIVTFASVYELFTRMIGILLNFILMGILFRNIEAESLGIWFILTSISGFIALFTFGFSPTFIRKLAFEKSSQNHNNFLELVKFGKQFYSYLQIIILLIYIVFAFFVLYLSDLDIMNTKNMIMVFLLGISYATMIKAQFYNDILIAQMKLIQSKHILLFYSISQSVILISASLMSGDIFFLALASVIIHIIYLQFTKIIFQKTNYKIYLHMKIKSKKFIKIFKLLFYDLKKYWLMSLGSFIILETDLLFLTYYFGPNEIPDYKALYTLIFTAFTISLIFMKNSYSLLSQGFAKNNLKIFSDIAIYPAMSLLFYGSTIIFLVPNIEYILQIWLGENHYIGFPIMLIFLIMLFLELQHTSLAIISIAFDNVPFARVALIAGLLNIVFTYIFQSLWGIIGVAAGTLFAQAITNNWYVVYKVMQLFNKSVYFFFIKITLPFIIFILIGVGFNLFIVDRIESNLVSIVLTGCSTVLFFIFMLVQILKRHKEIKRRTI